MPAARRADRLVNPGIAPIPDLLFGYLLGARSRQRPVGRLTDLARLCEGGGGLVAIEPPLGSRTPTWAMTTVIMTGATGCRC